MHLTERALSDNSICNNNGLCLVCVFIGFLSCPSPVISGQSFKGYKTLLSQHRVSLLQNSLQYFKISNKRNRGLFQAWPKLLTLPYKLEVSDKFMLATVKRRESQQALKKT